MEQFASSHPLTVVLVLAVTTVAISCLIGLFLFYLSRKLGPFAASSGAFCILIVVPILLVEWIFPLFHIGG
jgi:hypothetical protein